MSNYLYNGVTLPKIPEWDKETYPYAIICRMDSGIYRLICLTESNTVTADGDMFVASTTDIFVSFDLKDGEWVQGTAGAYFLPVVWSNTDLYTTDGTLYLAASEPVPIGGAFPLHAESFLKGLEIGRLLKARMIRNAMKPQ